MILLRKLFAKSRGEQITKLIGQTETITMEVLKAISMYWIISDENNKDKGENVDHWIDKAAGYINKDLIYGLKDSFVYPHMAFIGIFDDNTVKNFIGDDGLQELREAYKSPQVFLNGIINAIKIKYKPMLGQNPDSYFWKLSDYNQVFKYISLSIGGFISPDKWNEKGTWIKQSIPTVSKINYTRGQKASNDIKEIILTCIENIYGVG